MLLQVACMLCVTSVLSAPQHQQVQYVPQQPQHVQYVPKQQQQVQYVPQQQQQVQYVPQQQQNQLPTQQIQYVTQPGQVAYHQLAGAAPQQQYQVAPALPAYQPRARLQGTPKAGPGLALKSRPAIPGQKQDIPEDYDPNPQYQFSFDVRDDEFTNYQNRKEEREGDTITGSYSVVDSDGYIRTVSYTADPLGGFKAEVVREPTDIVVRLPVPYKQELGKAGSGGAGIQYVSQGTPQYAAPFAVGSPAGPTKLAKVAAAPVAYRKVPAGGQPVPVSGQPGQSAQPAALQYRLG